MVRTKIKMQASQKHFVSTNIKAACLYVDGIDYLNLHQSLKEIRGKPREPIARLPPSDWACVGCVPTIDRDYTNYAYFLHDAEKDVMRSINNSLQKFWQIEECDSSEILIPIYREKSFRGCGKFVEMDWKLP